MAPHPHAARIQAVRGIRAEAAEIAARQTAAAQALFEEAAPAWLVTWGYEGSGALAERPDLFGSSSKAGQWIRQPVGAAWEA